MCFELALCRCCFSKSCVSLIVPLDKVDNEISDSARYAVRAVVVFDGLASWSCNVVSCIDVACSLLVRVC